MIKFGVKTVTELCRLENLIAYSHQLITYLSVMLEDRSPKHLE